MQVLWAPWRMAYINTAEKSDACLFCSKARERRDSTNLIVDRGRHGFAMMNRFPYNSGHVLIAPYTHVDSLERLQSEEALDLINLTNRWLGILRTVLKPEGFNLGINLGKVSGAGIEAHVHLHIVPRWNGDTNFMPLFSETRVIPEHLQATYRKLRAQRLVLSGRRKQAGAAGLSLNGAPGDRQAPSRMSRHAARTHKPSRRKS